jgi:putative colanic acid biosynthesis UDP-glucose lipid carrier transferase
MYISVDQEHYDKIPHLIKLCDQYLIRIKFVPDFRRYAHARRVNIDIYDGVPVMMFRKEPLEAPINRILKRIFDIFFSIFVLLAVCSWLFPILAILIKLGSKGPVFFKQKRSGENNVTFHCYKFRTMKVNNLSDQLQAVKNDSRITKIGAFMRKTNLDELPQFVNVLIGNMSCVGPRPHMIAHTYQYSEQITNYLVRHYTRPGITGWAQINGYRGETKTLEEMEERIKHDIYYIENWSFFLDIKIIGWTIINMITGQEKAY